MAWSDDSRRRAWRCWRRCGRAPGTCSPCSGTSAAPAQAGNSSLKLLPGNVGRSSWNYPLEYRSLIWYCQSASQRQVECEPSQQCRAQRKCLRHHCWRCQLTYTQSGVSVMPIPMCFVEKNKDCVKDNPKPEYSKNERKWASTIHTTATPLLPPYQFWPLLQPDV